MSKVHLHWEAFTEGAFEDYPCVLVWGFASLEKAEIFRQGVIEAVDDDDRDFVFLADGGKYQHFGTWVVGFPVAGALANILNPSGRVHTDC